MKKFIALALGAILCLGLLAACGTPAASTTPSPEPALTGEALAQHYMDAITAGRTEQDNTDRPINYTGDDADMTMVWELLGVTADQLDAYALSISLMNVQAYCVGLFKPVAGQEDAVLTAIQAYQDNIEQSFSSYLPDQYEIAQSAKVEQLSDSTIAIVMCADAANVYDAIVAAL